MPLVTRDEVLKAGLDLPPQERIAVARELARSVPSAEGEDLPEAEWNAAWADEAERRNREIEEGKVKTIPGEEVMARVRAILRS
jgi:putative addiction module component (TIGR02574 family)